MDAGTIVVAFNVREQIAAGLVPGFPVSLVDEFDLQRVEPKAGAANKLSMGALS